MDNSIFDSRINDLQKSILDKQDEVNQDSFQIQILSLKKKTDELSKLQDDLAFMKSKKLEAIDAQSKIDEANQKLQDLQNSVNN